MSPVSHYPAKILVIDDTSGIHQALTFLLQPEISVYAAQFLSIAPKRSKGWKKVNDDSRRG